MPDLQPYMPYIIGVAALLLAAILIYVLMRLFNRRTRGRKGMRLGIVEYHEIDQNRRLVLLRRDDVEHLVLIGGNQDLVVENNISADFDRSQASASMDDYAAPRPPRPAVFGAKRPVLRPVDTNNRNDGPDTV